MPTDRRASRRLAFLALLAVGGALASLGCSPSPGGAAPTAPVAGAAGPAPVTGASGSAAVAGQRAEGEAFQVTLELPSAARPGEAATARIVVTARGTYHVNPEYPMAFRPDPASTAAFAGARVALGEGAARTACKDRPEEACTVSAPLGFTAPAAGESRIVGTLAFSVCNPERCLIEKVPLSAAVLAR
jgi:hypothetical protein